jgi:hypothetical protein
VSNPFTSLKETVLGLALKAFLNHEIEPFGRVRELAIDTNRKTMRAEVDLKGEPSPISIEVGAYELNETNGVVHIAFQNVITSKEWITGVLNKYVVGRPFPLPNAARKFL